MKHAITTGSALVSEAAWQELRASLAADQPDLNCGLVLHELRAFATWRGAQFPLTVPPSQQEVERYLAACSAEHGGHLAALKLHRIQSAACVLWGMPYASLIAIVRRQRQRGHEAKARSNDESLRALIARLPEGWRAGLEERMSCGSGNRKRKWSNAHLRAVAYALRRWIDWCDNSGFNVTPSGVAFFAYARDLSEEGVSSRSVGDYLGRILSGYASACDPGFRSMACDHVIARLNAQGKAEGRPTKTGEQLVGASAIFDLGEKIIDGARASGPRNLFVARDYRNGLLLLVAAAVPQRARALSHFEIGRTIRLLERPYVQVSLPGTALKLREHEKDNARYDRVLGNPVLWDAVDEYKRVFRPLFDNGSALFPSLLEVGGKVSGQRLGCLAGNLTQKHLGIRVSIHRIRDNVATEASEELSGGGYIAPVLLDNRDPATTMASYDHAEGLRAARDHAEFVTSRRSFSANLRL